MSSDTITVTQENSVTRITILERGENTIIKINGFAIHEGSGEHTREAMRCLSEGFATYLGFDIEYDEEDDD
jgi:hypothetical protein